MQARFPEHDDAAGAGRSALWARDDARERSGLHVLGDVRDPDAYGGDVVPVVALLLVRVRVRVRVRVS